MGENRRIVKYFREKIVKSFLDALILKTLKDETGVTGYNMMTRFNEKFAIMLSSGTIYSTLHGLERKRLIQSIVKGRSRTYTLTDHGKSFIDALMGDHQIQQFIVLLEKPVSNTHIETPNFESHLRQMQKTA